MLQIIYLSAKAYSILIIKLKKRLQVFFANRSQILISQFFRLQFMLAWLSPVGRSAAKMQPHKN
jgi:hypothetical protein